MVSTHPFSFVARVDFPGIRNAVSDRPLPSLPRTMHSFMSGRLCFGVLGAQQHQSDNAPPLPAHNSLPKASATLVSETKRDALARITQAKTAPRDAALMCECGRNSPLLAHSHSLPSGRSPLAPT